MIQDAEMDHMDDLGGELGGKGRSFSFSVRALNKNTVQSLRSQLSTLVWSQVNTKERKTENERNRERRVI